MVSAGQDDWVHINCALWSAEVYEDDDGKLQNVHLALARSRKLVRMSFPESSYDLIAELTVSLSI